MSAGAHFAALPSDDLNVSVELVKVACLYNGNVDTPDSLIRSSASAAVFHVDVEMSCFQHAFFDCKTIVCRGDVADIVAGGTATQA